MSAPIHEPPTAAELADLRSRPNLQHPDQQAIIERLASGEISIEECIEIALEVSLKYAKAGTARREAEATAGSDLSTIQEQRLREDQEILRNQQRDEPEILAPVTAFEQLPGSGGASGSWQTQAVPPAVPPATPADGGVKPMAELVGPNTDEE